LSKRTPQPAMAEGCSVPRRVGTIRPWEQATPEACAVPVEAARTSVHEQEVAHRDETSGRQGNQPAWLWGAVTTGGTGCVVRRSRGGPVARALVGERCGGLWVTDRSSADNGYPVRWRQRCGAHGLRDVAARRDRGGCAEASGDAVLAHAHQMCPWWHRVRAGTLQRSTLRSSRSPMRREVERLLDAGSRCGVPQTDGTCRDLLKRREAWWTVVHVHGVAPTKKTAERALRPGVLWRKGSFGTQRDEGSRVVESLMTVVATVKPQQRHVFAYLTAACEAALRGEAAPSLLPVSDQQSQAVA